MVMIRCPNCGQRTLDVASKCPKCGHVLLQNPLEASGQSELISCRRCGKHIDRHTRVCPYCGHHVSRARKLIVTGWVIAAVLVVGAAGVGAWRAGYLDALIPQEPPVVETLPTPAPAPEPETPPSAQPIVVPPVDTAGPVDSATAPPESAAAPPPQPVAVPGAFQVRWTSDWANVRERRSVGSPVIRVLAPGSEVSVARMRDGWWEYYEAGALRGYIANSVLGADRPTGNGPSS